MQVLEAKYADLCCKCNKNIMLYNENIVFASMRMHYLHIAHFANFEWLLMHFPMFPSTISANDVTGLKESEEKLKQQQQESARRENILVMRLATKEQEMQECTVCIYHSFPFWPIEKSDPA